MPLSIPQQTIANNNTRFKVVSAGRRFGKSTLAIRELAKAGSIPDQEIYYIAPSYRMAKTILWKKLKRKLTDVRWIKKINETELSITLKNNSVISLKGADNPDSLRGVSLNFVVFDEFAYMDDSVWYEVIRPALSDQQGRALFITTPCGKANWAFDLYNMPMNNDDWKSFSYTTADGGFVTIEEIEKAKQEMDERTFKQEYLASWESYGSIIAYNFNRDIHCNIPDLIKQLNITELHIGMDFNNTPITAAICIKYQNVLYQIDEVFINDSNTDEMAIEIKQRYPGVRLLAYPDPAGRQRKTSANGRTDFTILENHGFKVFAPYRHNEIKDRINSLNARLKTMDNKNHLFIHPKCKNTIESLEKYSYKDGTMIPDKSKGVDHMFDALSYCVDYLFPIEKVIEKQSPKTFGHRLA